MVETIISDDPTEEERIFMDGVTALINKAKDEGVRPDSVIAMLSNVLGRLILYTSIDAKVVMELVVKNIGQGYKERLKEMKDGS